jgi:hypothetical protein
MRSGCLVRRIRFVSIVVVPLNRSNTYVATSMVLTWNSVFSSFHDGGDPWKKKSGELYSSRIHDSHNTLLTNVP